jgi:hypothetical protein
MWSKLLQDLILHGNQLLTNACLFPLAFTRSWRGQMWQDRAGIC